MIKIIEKDNKFSMPKVGEIIQGKLIDKGNASVFLDIGALGTGIIYGKEFYEARNRLKDLKVGDTVFAKIIDIKNEDGYVDLSLNKAKKEMAWQEVSQKKEKGEVFTVKILGANKGGLITQVSGISAFLPVSQLSAVHYPKVDGGDTQKILQQLQKFIGKEMEVKVLDSNPHDEKLILSEKAKEIKKIEKALKDYKVGDIVDVEATGIANFGVFVKFTGKAKEKEDYATEPEQLEGLIHISELSWQLVKNPSELIKIGQKFKAKIIDITENKVSLSLKAIEKDPWKNIKEKYKKGNIVKGKITKLDSFGALVEITPEIQGLCHISQFSFSKKMEEELKPGQEYEFKVSFVDPLKHRMSLEFIEKNHSEIEKDDKSEEDDNSEKEDGSLGGEAETEAKTDSKGVEKKEDKGVEKKEENRDENRTESEARKSKEKENGK